MGFLRRLLGQGEAKDSWPPRGPITDWPTAIPFHELSAYLFPTVGSKLVDVVGESHHQGSLEQIGGGKTVDGIARPDHTAILLPEPRNPYDPNAVRVILATKSKGISGHCGYLAREDAVTYRSIINRIATAGLVTACQATLTGGWDRGRSDVGSIGVSLHLGTVADCEVELVKEPPEPTWE